MKSIYLMTDLEGVAGVVAFEEHTYPTARHYEHAKKLLTAEINAAVEGLLSEGVDDILVVDGHGPGGIWFEDLHPEAKLLHGRPITGQIMRQPMERYDAVALLGQHAMAGVGTSNLSHTQNSRAIDYFKLNGRPIGEIAQLALYAGALGKPMIFLTGEVDACKEAEELIPGITTISVKQGLGRCSAITISAQKSRQLIREGVAQAVRLHRANPIQPLVWPGPYTLEKRFYSTHEADNAMMQPGYERIDGQTVRVSGDDIRDVIYR